MTIKVNRQKFAEEYNTTSDWVADHFAKKYSNENKFATIEEKMVDIKSRVGFDKVSGIRKSAKKSCGAHENYADDCMDCSKARDGDLTLEEIDFLKEEIKKVMSDPLVSNTPSNVISKCKGNSVTSSIINRLPNKSLLNEYIVYLIPKNKGVEQVSLEDSSYIPLEEVHSAGDIVENPPEYAAHGFDG